MPKMEQLVSGSFSEEKIWPPPAPPSSAQPNSALNAGPEASAAPPPIARIEKSLFASSAAEKAVLPC
jgi:hypothetical protein